MHWPRYCRLNSDIRPVTDILYAREPHQSNTTSNNVAISYSHDGAVTTFHFRFKNVYMYKAYTATYCYNVG